LSFFEQLRECGIQGNSIELFTFNSKILLLLLFINIYEYLFKIFETLETALFSILNNAICSSSILIGPCCLHVYALNIRKRKQGDELKNLRAHHKFVTSSRRAFVTLDDTAAEPVALIMLYSH